MSAPMSRCRTRRRRCNCPTPDDRAKAVGAANTLWLDGGRAEIDQHRRRGFHRQSRRHGPGLGSRTADRGRARRRRRGACGGLWADRAGGRAHPRRQPHLRAGSRAAGPVRRSGRSRSHWHDAAASSPMPGCWSTRPRSAWPASRRSTSTLTPLRAERGRRRSRLCAARNRAAQGGASSAGCAPSTVSGCCCTRRSAASSAGSACGQR